jgi:ABC-type nitrate/sulfonate/bicarbonate transport system substrate-binding protein
MPVGTRASVKGVDVERLAELGAQIMLVNTYHLWLKPGPERVQSLGKGKIIALDTTARTGEIMVMPGSKIESVKDLANVPIAVTWHAGTFYAAIEVLEAAGVPFDQIKLL